jgi:hypothetical protein
VGIVALFDRPIGRDVYTRGSGHRPELLERGFDVCDILGHQQVRRQLRSQGPQRPHPAALESDR